VTIYGATYSIAARAAHRDRIEYCTGNSIELLDVAGDRYVDLASVRSDVESLDLAPERPSRHRPQRREVEYHDGVVAGDVEPIPRRARERLVVGRPELDARRPRHPKSIGANDCNHAVRPVGDVQPLSLR